MKYIIRAVKYFVYICVIVMIVLAILVACGFVSSDINVMFKNGWKSVEMILLMFACVSAFYPHFGYTKRRATVCGDPAELRDGIVKLMDSRGYVLESEDDEKYTFRIKSILNRITRVFEDRITIEKGIGLYVEGLSKDVTRIVYALEYQFPKQEGDSSNE